MRENQIYTSTNYGDFIFRSANRDIDDKHVFRIATNMANNGWQGAPIEVSESEKDGKFVIEDGQHRYLACKMSNTPVKFMVVKGKSIYDLALQNSIKKGWTGMDYVKAYAEDGNYNYKKLKNLADEFKNVSMTDILRVIGDGPRRREDLQKGYVRLNDEQFFKAREILKSLVVLNECIENIGIKTKSAYKNNLVKLLKHDIIEPQRMVDKLDKHGRMLLPMSASFSQALEYLEMLYNYHQPKNTCVYFRERLKNLS